MIARGDWCEAVAGLALDRSIAGKVLERGGPPPLWKATVLRKRQRTAALQDAGAPKPARTGAWSRRAVQKPRSLAMNRCQRGGASVLASRPEHARAPAREYARPTNLPINRPMRCLMSNSLCISGSWAQGMSKWRRKLAMNCWVGRASPRAGASVSTRRAGTLAPPAGSWPVSRSERNRPLSMNPSVLPASCRQALRRTAILPARCRQHVR